MASLLQFQEDDEKDRKDGDMQECQELNNSRWRTAWGNGGRKDQKEQKDLLNTLPRPASAGKCREGVEKVWSNGDV
jgi:hypothetical protein